MLLLPLQLALPVVFVFGTIIGSFLNVVIYRLHTGKSLNDRSHCLSCAKQLNWYELVPLLSYIVLRARCHGCGAWIPGRYLQVELLTGVIFVLLYQFTTDPISFVLYAVLLCTLLVGTVYDLYHMIIPNEVVVVTCVLAAGIVGYTTYLAGALGTVVYAGGAAFAAFTVYAGLWWYSGGRWIGFGDAKLAAPLGALVGVSGVFSMVVLSFWVGALVSILLLGIQYVRGYAKSRIVKSPGHYTIKSEIPFAPFLVLAFILVMFLSIDVLALTSYVIEALYN